MINKNNSIKEDFFDKKIKNLFPQRIKHYIFDIIYFLNFLALPFHLLKKILKKYNNKKINMGCGATYLQQWINIDANPFRKKDMWLDLRRKWPLNKESIDGFIASHVVEHLYDDELIHFFSELNRVLKIGAFIHLEVPSLEILLDNYQKEHNGFLFNEICFWHGAHHQIFDANLLSKFLTDYGFEIVTIEFAKKCSNFLSVEELNEISFHTNHSLIIEAVKK